MLAISKAAIAETVEARQVQIAGAQAWDLLKRAEEIIVARGQQTLLLRPAIDSKEEILAQCLGRTGSLRAPTLKIGGRLLVGFNEEMYRRYLG